MVNRERLVNKFLSLAAISSPAKHEKALADVLTEELKSLGFEVMLDKAGEKVGGNTGNVIATKKGSVEGAVPIMFSAHMDTVSPTENWGYIMDGDTIRSNGKTILGADDKAGIAAILEGLHVVNERKIPHGDLQIAFTIGEEIGLLGAKYLDYSAISSRCVFVYDMGKPVGCVTIAAPSHDNILAKVYGRASHAGARPEDGINAIVAASKAIANMRIGRIDFETTANVGVISGGTARNIVPEYCEVKAEARSRNEKKLDAQVQHMVEAFHEAAAEMGAGIEIEIDRSYHSYRLSHDDEVVRLAVTAARRVGIEPEMHETGGGSDANIFNAHGLPATVIGIGYDKAHSVEEYIDISDFVKSAEMTVALIEVAAGA
ncbi:MAG: M20/M25/M40 family metallo-hydrolase [Armatimonadota bacterium]|nr:M20/M25/M40 family metallo-hydrolase [Armatimonadota bacterium]